MSYPEPMNDHYLSGSSCGATSKIQAITYRFFFFFFFFFFYYTRLLPGTRSPAGRTCSVWLQVPGVPTMRRSPGCLFGTLLRFSRNLSPTLGFDPPFAGDQHYCRTPIRTKPPRPDRCLFHCIIKFMSSFYYPNLNSLMQFVNLPV